MEVGGGASWDIKASVQGGVALGGMLGRGVGVGGWGGGGRHRGFYYTSSLIKAETLKIGPNDSTPKMSPAGSAETFALGGGVMPSHIWGKSVTLEESTLIKAQGYLKKHISYVTVNYNNWCYESSCGQ